MSFTADVPPTAAPKKVPGEAGVWFFLFGDMFVFATLFIVFLVERAKQVALFDLSQASLNQNFAALNTIFLLLSSLFVALAVRALRAAKGHLARRFINFAVLCGIAFIVVKCVEYHERIAANQTPSANDFYRLYFVLTGIHLAHLVLGLAVLALLFSLARKPVLTKTQWAVFEGGACYWHLVDLLWLVLFPLIFLVR